MCRCGIESCVMLRGAEDVEAAEFGHDTALRGQDPRLRRQQPKNRKSALRRRTNGEGLASRNQVLAAVALAGE